MDQTTSDARNEQLVRNVELDDVIEFLFAGGEHAVKLLSLRNRTGEAIQYESIT